MAVDLFECYFDDRSFLLSFEHDAMLETEFTAAGEEDLGEGYAQKNFLFRLKERLSSLTAPEQ